MIEFKNLSAFDFADIGEPGEFTDQNADRICINHEPYIEVNGNRRWGPDRGRDGLGGARDALLCTAIVTYLRT